MLTPVDIQEKVFSNSFRGYDATQVDAFLDQIISDYEALYKDNSKLQEEIDVSKDKLKRFEEMEENIKNTLLLAEKTATEVNKNAEANAQTINSEAESKAAVMLDEAETKSAAMLNEAESKSTAMLNEAETKSAAMLDEAETKSAAMLNEAESKSTAMLNEAESKSTAMLDEAESKSAAMLDEAESKSSAMLDEAEIRSTTVLSEARQQASQIINDVQMDTAASRKTVEKMLGDAGMQAEETIAAANKTAFVIISNSEAKVKVAQNVLNDLQQQTRVIYNNIKDMLNKQLQELDDLAKSLNLPLTESWPDVAEADESDYIAYGE